EAADEIERAIERAHDALHQHVDDEERVHLPEALGDDAFSVGEHALVAVRDLTLGDELGEDRDVPTLDEIEDVTKDEAPEEAEGDEEADGPDPADRGRDLGAEPGAAAERDDPEDDGEDRREHADAEPDDRVGHRAHEEADRGAEAGL